MLALILLSIVNYAASLILEAYVRRGIYFVSSIYLQM